MKVEIYYRRRNGAPPFLGFDREFERLGAIELDGGSVEAILELVFRALQHPAVEPLNGLLPLLTAYKLKHGRIPRSLSVGDLVAVDGATYYCDDIGWRRIGGE